MQLTGFEGKQPGQPTIVEIMAKYAVHGVEVIASVHHQPVEAHRQGEQALPLGPLGGKLLKGPITRQWRFGAQKAFEVNEAGHAYRCIVGPLQPAGGPVAPEAGASLAMLGQGQVEHGGLWRVFYRLFVVDVDSAASGRVGQRQPNHAVIGRGPLDAATQLVGDALQLLVAAHRRCLGAGVIAA